MLIYFEILELNFCNLNLNTAKNIEKREELDRKSTHSVSSLIELEGHYYLKADELKHNEEGKINDKSEETN